MVWSATSFARFFFYERKRYVWAVLFQALCIGSNANGRGWHRCSCLAFTLRIGGGRISTGSDGGVVWLLRSSCSPTYFLGYDVVTLPNALLLLICLGIALILSAWWGAPFSFDLSFYYGIAVVGACVWLFPWRSALRSPLRPLSILFAFCVGTMILAAIFRAGYSDAQFQTSRYLLYPQMLLGLLGFYGWRRVGPGLEGAVDAAFDPTGGNAGLHRQLPVRRVGFQEN